MSGLAIYRSIPLTRGKVAWVDQADYPMLSHWNWTWGGHYAVRTCRFKGLPRHTYMHRMLMLPDPDQQVDHINVDGLDCRRRNLRLATPTENHRNVKARRGSSSALRGVSWDKARGKWHAQITGRGSHHHVGRFLTQEEAGRAYDRMARQLHGDFARLNFPEETA